MILNENVLATTSDGYRSLNRIVIAMRRIRIEMIWASLSKPHINGTSMLQFYGTSIICAAHLSHTYSYCSLAFVHALLTHVHKMYILCACTVFYMNLVIFESHLHMCASLKKQWHQMRF